MIEAKVTIGINTYEQFKIKGDSMHIWSNEYDGLSCVLQEAYNPEGEGDCQVIIIADSRKQILDTWCKYPTDEEREDYEETLTIREDYESMCLDTDCFNNLWAKRQRKNGKYLLITPLELEALIPQTKDAAQQLFQVAMFKLQHDVTEENARVLLEVTKNCEKFLY